MTFLQSSKVAEYGFTSPGPVKDEWRKAVMQKAVSNTASTTLPTKCNRGCMLAQSTAESYHTGSVAASFSFSKTGINKPS